MDKELAKELRKQGYSYSEIAKKLRKTKKFAAYHTKDINIPDIIFNSNKKIKLEFLKAFFEDEGSISHNGRLAGDLKNKKIILQLFNLLKNFGFECNICSYNQLTGKMYKIYFTKSKYNLELFNNFNFFEKSKITHGKNKGKRKIEVLKTFISKV